LNVNEAEIMSKYLVDQHVVIVGGSSHMGLETARQARAAGAHVTLVSRNEEKLRSAAQSIGDDIAREVADATDDRSLEPALRKLGKIDHLVVTLSVSAPASSIVDTPVAVAQQAFERLWASYRVVQMAP
jgi:NAD(P)-dependent dehydrogenase (short-subunit alcohol dehydrogenase family)